MPELGTRRAHDERSEAQTGVKPQARRAPRRDPVAEALDQERRLEDPLHRQALLQRRSLSTLDRWRAGQVDATDAAAQLTATMQTERDKSPRSGSGAP